LHHPAPPDYERERAGSRALSVFARVLSAQILRAHCDGPLTSGELEARLGWAAKASLRVGIHNLCELGALVRTSPGLGRGTVTELTPAGHDLLCVADVLEHWLSRSPFGPIPLPDTAARGVVRALVAGWDSTIVGALAERPRSLSELNSEIAGYSYPALKRRLSMLRSASLATPLDGKGRSPAHAATEWLRFAVGPLSAASRWERTHRAIGSLPISRQEIEAALMLALPLVALPADISGEWILASPASQGAGEEMEPALAAVSAVVANGELVSLSSGAASTPTTWALGTADAWLDAMVDGCCDNLRLRGPDTDLVGIVVMGIHGALFPNR
jgi:DNA-binding HxlR family transcriptional regulator